MIKRLATASLAAFLLTGCTATQAIAVRSQYAGEAKQLAISNTDTLASEADYWRNLYERAEVNGLQGILPTYQADIQNLQGLSDTALAVQKAAESTNHFRDQLAAHEAQFGYSANVVSTHRQVGHLLGEVHTDLDKMATIEAQLPSEVAKHATVGIIAGATKVAGAYVASHPSTPSAPSPTPAPPSTPDTTSGGGN